MLSSAAFFDVITDAPVRDSTAFLANIAYVEEDEDEEDDDAGNENKNK